MKLLFFISSLRSGGAERVMAVLINELANRGYDITIGVMTPDQIFYELHPSIKILIYPFEKHKSFLGKLTNRLKMFSFIRKVTKEEKPDVIISFIYQMNTNVLLSTLFLNIPIIVSEHNTLDRKMSFLEKFQRLYISKLAERITILTNHDFNFLGKRLKNKIVMSNPVPFEAIKEYNGNRDKVILAIGSVKRYKHKGFDNLIEIWSLVENKFPEWRLEIAGDYDEISLNYLKSIEGQKCVRNKVTFLGQIKDVEQVLRRSSIFILSSRWEGFPMVLIEAMSQGCACISYDLVSGPKEIMTHELDGVLVKNQDMKEMARELSLLLENEEKRIRIASKGIKTVEQFSLKNTVDRWELLFNQLV